MPHFEKDNRGYQLGAFLNSKWDATNDFMLIWSRVFTTIENSRELQTIINDNYDPVSIANATPYLPILDLYAGLRKDQYSSNGGNGNGVAIVEVCHCYLNVGFGGRGGGCAPTSENLGLTRELLSPMDKHVCSRNCTFHMGPRSIMNGRYYLNCVPIPHKINGRPIVRFYLKK